MSDLAPFVAASIRDRNVIELMEENKRLNKAIAGFMLVQITGPNGAPVYAEGQFDQGGYGPGVDDWFPPIKQRRRCCLADLSHVELRVGGVVRFTLDPYRDNSIFMILDFPQAYQDRSDGKDMMIEADDGTELYVVVSGWSDSQWRPLLEDDAWDENADAALGYFQNMPNGGRDCWVSFEELSFSVTKYEAMIRQVSLSREQLEEREEQLHRQAFSRELFDRLEAAGIQVHRDDNFAYPMVGTLLRDLKISRPNDEFEQVIGPLINLCKIQARLDLGTYFEVKAFIDESRICEESQRNRALANFAAQVKQLAEVRRNEQGQRKDGESPYPT